MMIRPMIVRIVKNRALPDNSPPPKKVKIRAKLWKIYNIIPFLYLFPAFNFWECIFPIILGRGYLPTKMGWDQFPPRPHLNTSCRLDTRTNTCKGGQGDGDERIELRELWGLRCQVAPVRQPRVEPV